MIKSKNFSFGFVENIGKFIIFRRNIRKVRSLYEFCGVGLNVQRAKTDFKVVGA